MDYSILPHINATLNATSGLLLLAGFYFISRRRITAHLRCMTAAFIVSCIFLISYLVYHFNHGSTTFKAEGSIRAVYLTILASHTILAMVIVPLILMTLVRAWRGDFGRHRRIARWTFPLWLYVSLTGVIVYLMLYQIYPSR